MTDLSTLTAQELEALADKAQKMALSKKEEAKKDVRRKVLETIRESGFAFEDIFPGGAASRATRSTQKVKYRNPADPLQTWVGRGRKPRWLIEALAAGRSLNEFSV